MITVATRTGRAATGFEHAVDHRVLDDAGVGWVGTEPEVFEDVVPQVIERPRRTSLGQLIEGDTDGLDVDVRAEHRTDERRRGRQTERVVGPAGTPDDSREPVEAIEGVRPGRHARSLVAGMATSRRTQSANRSEPPDE